MKTNLLTRRTCLVLSSSLALGACGGADDAASPTSASPSSGSARQGPVLHVAPTEPGSRVIRPKVIAPRLIEPISQTGIRGDVLAQALRTQVSQTDADGKRLGARGVPWTDEAPRGSRDNSAPEPGNYRQPNVMIHQTITPGSSASALNSPFIYTYDPYTVRIRGSQITGWSERTVMLRFGLSARGLLDASITKAPLDTEVLQLGNRLDAYSFYHSRRIVDSALPSLDGPTTLTSREPYRIHRNEEIDWLEPLHRWGEWGDPLRARFVDLYVRPGQRERQFLLCFRTSTVETIKQQRACSHWEVPVGWAPGQALRHLGQSLSIQGNSIKRSWEHWYTLPEDLQVDPAAHWKTDTHHSSEGISGALLAALFDAWSPRGKGTQAFGQLDAYPSDYTFGRPERTPTRTNRIAYQSSRVTQYADGQGSGPYAPAQGTYLYSLRSGDIHAPGRPLPITAAPDFPQVTLALNVRANPQSPDQVFTLPRWLGMNIHTRQRAGESLKRISSNELYREVETVIAANQLIPYGTNINRWLDRGERGSVAELLLSTDYSQAWHPQLCWSTIVDVGKERRMPRNVCTRFEVPENWQPGQPVTPVAYDIWNDWKSWNNLPR